MRFNHSKFFDGFKTHFDSSLDQSQVDGIEFLLTHFEQEPLWDQVWKIAYGFATAFHETAGTMQPVEEGCYLAAQHSVAFMRRFQKSLRYYPYFGRGFVQLTWDTRRIPNYTRATRELKAQMPDLVAKFEDETGQTFDLVGHPEQALHPLVAFATMTLGMDQGWFTSKKLNDFDPADYYDMRTIINGHDKATIIATYARNFEKILNESLVSAAASSEGKAADPLAAESATEIPTGGSTNSSEQPPTSEVPPSPANKTDVVVEKEPEVTDTKPKGFFGPLWQKVTGAVTAAGGTDAAIEKAQQAKTFGLSDRTWDFIFYAIITGLVIWIVYHFVVVKVVPWGKWLLARMRTNQLVAANSTGDSVQVISADKLAEYEAKGYLVIKRS